MAEKSPRHKLADRFAAKIKKERYDNPRGGEVYLKTLNERKFYSVSFYFLGSVSGKINIYDENFIQIEYRVGEMTGEPVFENEKRAMLFFQTGIVKRMWEKASKIPRKPKKDS